MYVYVLLCYPGRSCFEFPPVHAHCTLVSRYIYTHHLSICLSIQLPIHLSIQVTGLSRYACICLALLPRTELLRFPALARPRHASEQIQICTVQLSFCPSIYLPIHLSIQVTDLSRYVCMCLALLPRTEFL